ncbi:MAG: helix-turn-helix transcriptional regulator [Clostridia bacterium]|nr:helix-turn-helix transcriptional regulator [Clostridia bacterium]
MEIKSVEIKQHLFHQFSMQDNDGLLHIKRLPYLSVVQSQEGSYGIKLGNSPQIETGRNGFFIAPAHVTQEITHHFDKNTNRFTARYIFLDVVINQKYHLDDIFDFPIVCNPHDTAVFNEAFDNLGTSQCICDTMSYFYNIIKHLLEIGTEKKVIQNQEIYPLIAYIEKNYSNEITIKDMANILKTSESHLYAIFKKATNLSPIKYLNHYRLSIASSLLVQTSDSIREIGEKVGIPDPFYFSKLFKMNYKISPQQYRKTNY